MYEQVVVLIRLLVLDSDEENGPAQQSCGDKKVVISLWSRLSYMAHAAVAYWRHFIEGETNTKVALFLDPVPRSGLRLNLPPQPAATWCSLIAHGTFFLRKYIFTRYRHYLRLVFLMFGKTRLRGICDKAQKFNPKYGFPRISEEYSAVTIAIENYYK